MRKLKVPEKHKEEVEVQLKPFSTSALGGGWVVSATPLPLYPQERDPLSIVQEAKWASEPV